MKIMFVERKISIAQKDKDAIEKRLTKLERFFTDAAMAQVKIREEREMKRVEVTVEDRGMLFRAERSNRDVLSCVDELVDIIVRQIRKNKTRLERRFHEKLPMYGDAEEQQEYNIVKKRQIELQPMSVDDAILQMNMLGHEFFMFRDMDSAKVCVVYCRRDGNYALLEPADI